MRGVGKHVDPKRGVCVGKRVTSPRHDPLPPYGWVRPDRGGAEGVNEPVRFLNDALKPKLYAYDRCADAYLRIPT